MSNIQFEAINQHCYENKTSNIEFLENLLKTDFFSKLKRKQRIRLFIAFLEEHSFLIYGVSDSNSLLVYEQDTEIVYKLHIIKSRTILIAHENTSREYIYNKNWILSKKTFRDKQVKLQLINPEFLISQIVLKFIKFNFLFTMTITYNTNPKTSNNSTNDYLHIVQNIYDIEKEINKINSVNIIDIIGHLKNFISKMNIKEHVSFRMVNCSTEKTFFEISSFMGKANNISYKDITYSCAENKLSINLKNDDFIVSDVYLIINIKNKFNEQDE